MHKIIPVTVRDKIATKTGDEVYICGNSDFVIEFDFDAEWDAFETKTARFEWNGEHWDEVFSGNTCPVPIISDTHRFHVGVYAGNLRTTTAAYVPARKSILCGGGLPHAPQPNVYAQIMEELGGRATQKQMKQAIDEAMDAEFFIVRVENNVSDKSDEDIRAEAEGKVCIAVLEPFGWLFTYVGDRPSSNDSSVYCPTFTLVWYKEYGKMTALDLEVHGNTVKVLGRDNVNLPNPYKLKLTGAVEAEYDGSKLVNVKIPDITEFFIVRIDRNNVSNHTEEEIQAAVGEGKICIAIEHTGEIYTYVGRMRKTNSESGYAETFYMPMKHAGAKADVIWIQISGNQAAKFLRNDARLANPWKLTLTGAVEAEYDGSKQVSVKIPKVGEDTALTVKSSTPGSTKRFRITVDDSGAITATELR